MIVEAHKGNIKLESRCRRQCRSVSVSHSVANVNIYIDKYLVAKIILVAKQ